MSSPVTVRVGIPLVGGRLVDHVRSRHLPILMSANAFARRYPKGHEREGAFRGFRTDLGHLEGLDCALDSGGFVAAAHYGDYPFSIPDYLDLVAARPWSWYSAPDYCVEPEVAGDRAIRKIRIAATQRNYAVCAASAARRGLPAPTPVLQGYEVSEYLECADTFPITEWPALVGVGSMCRRHIEGPHGLMAVVDALDRALPSHVKLHLFGVKSGALELLPAHRVASVDSMAWDASARAACRTGRSMDVRIEHMERWLRRQLEMQRRRNKRPDRRWLQALHTAHDTIRDITGERLADQILDGIIDYSDAKVGLEWSSCWAEAFAQNHGLTAMSDRQAIEQWMDENCL